MGETRGGNGWGGNVNENDELVERDMAVILWCLGVGILEALQVPSWSQIPTCSTNLQHQLPSESEARAEVRFEPMRPKHKRARKKSKRLRGPARGTRPLLF